MPSVILWDWRLFVFLAINVCVFVGQYDGVVNISPNLMSMQKLTA